MANKYKRKSSAERAYYALLNYGVVGTAADMAAYYRRRFIASGGRDEVSRRRMGMAERIVATCGPDYQG